VVRIEPETNLITPAAKPTLLINIFICFQFYKLARAYLVEAKGAKQDIYQHMMNTSLMD